MRIVLLTTDTPHHRYFVNKINEEFFLSKVFFETTGLDTKKMLLKNFIQPKNWLKKAKILTFSPYWQLPLWEGKELIFEKNQFFKKTPYNLPLGIPVQKVNNINDGEVIEGLEEISPDIIVLFGVTKIKSSIIKTARIGVLNVHRGIVPAYRGLDSDLWAIYHDDFANIGSTVHFVDTSLDTGYVVYQEKYSILPSDEIYHLRYHTTVIATELVRRALRDTQKGVLKGYSQGDRGRYFSFMPYFLKFRVMYKFWRYKTKLRKEEKLW